MFTPMVCAVLFLNGVISSPVPTVVKRHSGNTIRVSPEPETAAYTIEDGGTTRNTISLEMLGEADGAFNLAEERHPLVDNPNKGVEGRLVTNKVGYTCTTSGATFNNGKTKSFTIITDCANHEEILNRYLRSQLGSLRFR